MPIVDGRLTLPGAPESGIGSLRLTVNGRQRVVPVLSKGEVVHTFFWDQSNLPKPMTSLALVGDLTGWVPLQSLKSMGLLEPMHTVPCFVRATIPTNGLWMANGC